MFDGIIVAILNHLLQAEPWASERLRTHAGAQALIRAGRVELHLAIDGTGLFERAQATPAPDVTISLPGDAPVRLMLDRGRLFQAAKLSGSADLAETLAFVFRNLHWDIEADLAHLVGDIPARRLEMLRRSMARQATESLTRVFQNFAEYANEDSGLLAPPRDVADFVGAVDVLRDDLARLEKRLTSLA